MRGVAGGVRVVGHEHQGAGGPWTRTLETADLDREPGARATKHLTELQNSGVLNGSRLRLGLWERTRGGWRLAGHQHGGAGGLTDGTCETADRDRELQQRAWGSWRLAAGGVRNIKDRDVPALEVRAGTPGVGRTAWDAAGLSSTTRN